MDGLNRTPSTQIGAARVPSPSSPANRVSQVNLQTDPSLSDTGSAEAPLHPSDIRNSRPAGSNPALSRSALGNQASLASEITGARPERPEETRPTASVTDPQTTAKQEALDSLQWFQDRSGLVVDGGVADFLAHSDNAKECVKKNGFDFEERTGADGRRTGILVERLIPEGGKTDDFKMLSDETSKSEQGGESRTRKFSMNGRNYEITESFDSTGKKPTSRTLSVIKEDGTRESIDASFENGTVGKVERSTYREDGSINARRTNEYRDGLLERSGKVYYNEKGNWQNSGDSFYYSNISGKNRLSSGRLDNGENYRLDFQANGAREEITERAPGQSWIDARRTVNSRTYEDNGTLRETSQEIRWKENGKNHSSTDRLSFEKGRAKTRHITAYEDSSRKTLETIEYDRESEKPGPENIESREIQKFGNWGEVTDLTKTDGQGNLLSRITTDETDGRKTQTSERYTYKDGKLSRVTVTGSDMGEHGLTTKRTQAWKEYDSEGNLTQEAQNTYNKYGSSIVDKKITGYYPDGRERMRFFENTETGYKMYTSYEQEQGTTKAQFEKTQEDGSRIRINTNRATRYQAGSARSEGAGRLTLDEFKGICGAEEGVEKFHEMLKNEGVDGVNFSTQKGKPVFTCQKGDETHIFRLNDNHNEYEVITGDILDYNSETTCHNKTGNFVTDRRSYKVADGVVTSEERYAEDKEGNIHRMNYNVDSGRNRSARETTITNKAGKLTRRETDETDFNKNERLYTIDYDGDGKPEVTGREFDSNNDGKMDTIRQEDFRSRKVSTWVDRNGDGSYAADELSDNYEYHRITNKRNDINRYSNLGVNGYYDNLVNYLSPGRGTLNQEVRIRNDSVVSVFTGENKNVEVKYHYTNPEHLRMDPRKTPCPLNGETPSFVSIKTEGVRHRNGVPHETTIEKIVFPGTEDSYITTATEKGPVWTTNAVHTHFMDKGNKNKTNNEVRDVSADNASMGDLTSKAMEMGVREFPRGFEDFKNSVGDGKMSVNIQTVTDQLDGSKNRQQITAVDDKTGNRFIMTVENGQVVSSFKDGKTGNETLDIGGKTIRSTLRDRQGSNRELENYDYQLIHENGKSESIDLSDVLGTGRFGVKNVQAGVGGLNLLTAMKKVSKTTTMAQRAAHSRVSSDLSKHLRNFDAALSGLTLSATVIDIATKENVNHRDVNNLVGDMANLGFDLTKSPYIKGLLYRNIPAGSGKVAGLSSGLKWGGRALGGIAVASNLYSGTADMIDGKYISGGLNFAAAGGAAVGLIFAGSSWAGPVGWGIAALAIAGQYINSSIEQDQIHNVTTSPLEREFGMSSILPRAFD